MVNASAETQDSTEVARLSGARLRALKTKTNYTTSWRFVLRRFVIQLVEDTQEYIGQLWLRLSYSCEKQGHVLDTGGWRPGSLPTCAHCGQKVKSLSDRVERMAS
jgi:hypothetical protein